MLAGAIYESWHPGFKGSETMKAPGKKAGGRRKQGAQQKLGFVDPCSFSSGDVLTTFEHTECCTFDADTQLPRMLSTLYDTEDCKHKVDGLTEALQGGGP